MPPSDINGNNLLMLSSSRLANGWIHVASRSKRFLNSIVLDVGIRELKMLVIS